MVLFLGLLEVKYNHSLSKLMHGQQYLTISNRSRAD